MEDFLCLPPSKEGNTYTHTHINDRKCVGMCVFTKIVEGGMQEILSKHKKWGKEIGNQKERLFPSHSEKQKHIKYLALRWNPQ